MATFNAQLFASGIDFTQFKISDFAAGIVTVSSAATYRLSRGGDYDEFTGLFVYADGVLVGGTVNEWSRSVGGVTQFTVSGLGLLGLSVTALQGFIASNNTAGFLAALFSGDDEFSGSLLADHLLGLGGHDTLAGGSGNDTLEGGAGNDDLDGGIGADRMLGGAGHDDYVVDDKSDVVVEGLNQGFDYVQSAVDFILGANLENLSLTGSATKGTGNALANEIHGNVGNEVLFGLGGNDTLHGHGGNNTLVGSTGNDTYFVDAAGSSEIQELAGQGIDIVLAMDVDYTLGVNLENLQVFGSKSGTGNELNNLIHAGDVSSDSKLSGLAGNDTLDGLHGKDTLIGGLGNDLYIVWDGDEVIVEGGSEGTDTVRTGVDYSLASNVDNLVLDGTGDINGTGNGLANILIGNSGNNNLIGGAGADKMMGGIGDDSYSVDDAKDVVIEGAKQGTDTVTAHASYTLGANLENLRVDDGFIATGNGGANRITGLFGNNTLIGAAGNDTLDGSPADTVAGGVDSMAGGLGNDVYILRPGNEGSTLTELPNQGIDLVQSDIDWTLGANFENLDLNAPAATNGTGNGLNNQIFGNGADNILSGLAGNDDLRGGVGADTLLGGTGNDTLDGESDGTDKLQGGLGNDLYIVYVNGVTIAEDLNQGTDTVKSGATFILGANLENLTLTGSGDIDGSGNGLANVLIGNSGDNFLFGGAGNDKMAGGAGNDTYNIDSNKDAITEGANQGIDSVQSSVNLTLGANLENLHLLAGAANGTGNGLKNQITGNSDGNILNGLAGNDELEGGLGADTLLGGTGNDLLNGGGGADQINAVGGQDRVIYAGTADAGDVIIGFAAKGTDQDFIDLDLLFDSLGVATAQRDDRVSFVDAGADVELRIDTDGVGGADLTLLTFKGMASTADLTVGNASTTDVLIGTM